MKEPSWLSKPENMSGCLVCMMTGQYNISVNGSWNLTNLKDGDLLCLDFSLEAGFYVLNPKPEPPPSPGADNFPATGSDHTD